MFFAVARGERVGDLLSAMDLAEENGTFFDRPPDVDGGDETPVQRTLATCLD